MNYAYHRLTASSIVLAVLLPATLAQTRAFADPPIFPLVFLPTGDNPLSVVLGVKLQNEDVGEACGGFQATAEIDKTRESSCSRNVAVRVYG